MAYSFGPTAWKCFNEIAQNFSDFKGQDIKKLFIDIAQHLPCKGCRKHYTNFINNIVWENVVSSKESFIIFLTDLHNSVNWRQNKEIIDYPTASNLILNSSLPGQQEIIDCLPKAIYKLFNDTRVFKKMN